MKYGYTRGSKTQQELTSQIPMLETEHGEKYMQINDLDIIIILNLRIYLINCILTMF